jgi:radical SAM superfamily enzyme YgiQ (UPF0313 family)
MKFHLIYPSWPKLEGQTHFNLPPHGPVVMAAALPDYVEIEFTDENVDEVVYHDDTEFVGISVMLTSQIKRGWEIADEYRKRGKKVIFGGISSMLHAKETKKHADSVFLGEAEGRMEEVFDDFKKGQLKPEYNYMATPPDTAIIGPAKRSILNRGKYSHKGIQMVDLVHASRGCQFNCAPCCVPFLGGRNFRPRPIDKFIEELETIDNNRLFIVDNTLAQDKKWEMELFRQMIPLKKKWCSHTIDSDPKILDLAAQAGAWYVYQAIFDTSDYIRDRIKRYHDYGIKVEGTILLGTDDQTVDDIYRLIDFLQEIELDLAEFTVLTPFPETQIHRQLLKQNRIFDHDYYKYNAGNVVFEPKHMSAEKLQELFAYAWKHFYGKETQEFKMFKLILTAINREIEDGTYRPRNEDMANISFGRRIKR